MSSHTGVEPVYNEGDQIKQTYQGLASYCYVQITVIFKHTRVQALMLNSYNMSPISPFLCRLIFQCWKAAALMQYANSAASR